MRVIFDAAGGANEFLEDGISSWSLDSSNPYTRQYHFNGYEITIIGDFGSQSADLSEETEIVGLEFHNLSTGTGAKYFGFSLSYSDMESYLGNLLMGRVDFTGSDVDDEIDLGLADENSSVFGRGGNDSILGSVSSDVIDGGSGNDTLTGGEGTDRLTGGTGEDWFVFQRLTEVGLKWWSDKITDFKRGDDVIDLSDFVIKTRHHGDTTTEWLVNFEWRGSKTLRSDHDDLRYRHTFDDDKNPITVIEGSFDRDKQPEFSIVLDGKMKLSADDFFLGDFL